MEIARDEVRVMTVHGAKGLEAPIVFLADTMTPPAGPRPPRLLELADKAVIWAGRKADDPPPVAAARQDFQREATDEYRRLLYVAMTRAADRLIVCGAEGERRRPDGCWYDLICEPLKPFLVEETDGEDKVFRYRTAESPVLNRQSRPRARHSQSSRSVRHFPTWLRDRVPHRTTQRGPIAPSSAFDEEFVPVAQRGPSAAARRKALGTRPHRASADAVFARYCPRAARRGVRAFPRARRSQDFFRRRAGRNRKTSRRHSRRSAIRRNLSAQQPRRGADCRPDLAFGGRAARHRRTGGPLICRLTTAY